MCLWYFVVAREEGGWGAQHERTLFFFFFLRETFESDIVNCGFCMTRPSTAARVVCVSMQRQLHSTIRYLPCRSFLYSCHVWLRVYTMDTCKVSRGYHMLIDKSKLVSPCALIDSLSTDSDG